MLGSLSANELLSRTIENRIYSITQEAAIYHYSLAASSIAITNPLGIFTQPKKAPQNDTGRGNKGKLGKAVTGRWAGVKIIIPNHHCTISFYYILQLISLKNPRPQLIQDGLNKGTMF